MTFLPEVQFFSKIVDEWTTKGNLMFYRLSSYFTRFFFIFYEIHF